MRKLNSRGYVALGIIVLIIIYFGGVIHYHSHFLPHTEILGTKIAGKSVDQADKILIHHLKTNQMTLVENGKTVAKDSQQTIGIRKDFKQPLKELARKQHAWDWPIKVLTNNAQTIPNSRALLNQKTLERYSRQTADKLNQKRQPSKDAYLTYRNGKLITHKQHQGNQISATRLAKAISTSVDHNQNTVKLNATYIKPLLTTNMAKFKQAKSKMTKMGNVSGAIKIYDHKSLKVSRQRVQSWIKENNGDVQLDTSKIETFLDQINHQYATYGKDHKFKSTKEGTVDVKGGIYGWSVDKKQELTMLSQSINDGKNFHRWVATTGRGYHRNGTDIGSTYVEVDIKNQHEYFYKKGKLLMDSDVVTGNPTKHKSTPTGVDYIWSKQRNATLHGANYSQPVKYWMPVNDTGVGLHDSPWQPRYGGNWYLSHGSHGCVNNPPVFVAKLYKAVSVGTPVVIFNK